VGAGRNRGTSNGTEKPVETPGARRNQGEKEEEKNKQCVVARRKEGKMITMVRIQKEYRKRGKANY